MRLSGRPERWKLHDMCEAHVRAPFPLRPSHLSVQCQLDRNEFSDGVVWIARLRLADPLLPPPSEQRARVMEQLADVFLELEKHPLPLTRSLVPDPESGEGGGISEGRQLRTAPLLRNSGPGARPLRDPRGSLLGYNSSAATHAGGP